MPHLPAALQLVKNLSDLLRLHQRIRPVQQQAVDMIRAQPCQNTVHRPLNILSGEIIEPVMDRAFRLDEHLLAKSRLVRQYFAEDLLALPAPVNIRMVKEIDPLIQRRMHQRVRIAGAHPGDPHTADADARDLHIIIQIQILHLITSSGVYWSFHGHFTSEVI